MPHFSSVLPPNPYLEAAGAGVVAGVVNGQHATF